MGNQDVVGLAEVGTADLPAVGGKAANLGELIRIGMPVEVVFDDIAPDCTLPQFRPAKGTL